MFTPGMNAGGLLPVHLVGIDDVGAQAPQRVLNLLDDARAAGVAEHLAIAPVQPDIRRNNDFVACSDF
jgi:hypothetical protein